MYPRTTAIRLPLRIPPAAVAATLLWLSPALYAGSAGNWRDSEQIWDSTCQYCHAAVTVGPALFGRDLPRDYIRDWARQGHLRMPPFPLSEISDVELEQLADWINRQAAAEPVPAP